MGGGGTKTDLPKHEAFRICRSERLLEASQTFQEPIGRVRETKEKGEESVGTSEIDAEGETFSKSQETIKRRPWGWHSQKRGGREKEINGGKPCLKI